MNTAKSETFDNKKDKWRCRVAFADLWINVRMHIYLGRKEEDKSHDGFSSTFIWRVFIIWIRADGITATKKIQDFIWAFPLNK